MRRSLRITSSPLRTLWVAMLCGGALACSVEEGGPGEECLRSTECAPGLVCIEGVCSNDLSAIGDPGVVPELMPDAGMEPVLDAGEPPADAAMSMMPTGGGAAMPPIDAAMMMPAIDAAMPVDGS